MVQKVLEKRNVPEDDSMKESHKMSQKQGLHSNAANNSDSDSDSDYFQVGK